MQRLLIIDDQPQDLRVAVDAARQVGTSIIESHTSAQSARKYLDKCLAGELPLPDGIVLDLDLGYESGFELLRFWHSTPQLSSIPMVVWSILEDQRQVCELFKVNFFVAKWQGSSALQEALIKLRS